MIFIGLGANLASKNYTTPKETLLASLDHLTRYDIQIDAVSYWYQSAPVPLSDAPWYVNAVAQISTSLPPRMLLKTLLEVESAFGRVRSTLNAPRIIDLDLIAYHDHVEKDEIGEEEKPFCIPHPRFHERAFVLVPIQDLAPTWTDPKTGMSLDTLITQLDPTQKIERMLE